MKRPPFSLRAQAVAWLAQRDHSELELRRKLVRRLMLQNVVAAADRGGAAVRAGDLGANACPTPFPEVDARNGAPSPLEQVDDTIAWLRERGYLDEERFVASRVDLRSGRFGLRRIQNELSLHGLTVTPETARALRSTELERATALWQRKFGRAPGSQAEAARHSRFLSSRGFSGEVVRQVLRAAAAAASGGQGG